MLSKTMCAVESAAIISIKSNDDLDARLDPERTQGTILVARHVQACVRPRAATLDGMRPANCDVINVTSLQCASSSTSP
jgi:hypothetical protein